MSSPLLSGRFDQALRWASEGHRDQVRRASGVPYVQHVVAVAWILERLGFGEDAVIAGLLHDMVEDVGVSLADVEARFGPVVARLVERASEIKLDAEGRKRPWIDRKTDHLAALAGATVDERAVVLADKLHNLVSIQADLAAGLPVWTGFNAPRDRVLWYYDASISTCGAGDPRLERLAAECRSLLEILRARDEDSIEFGSCSELPG